MHMSVHAARQDKLTRCVKLPVAVKRASNLHDNTKSDSNVGATYRTGSCHDLPITNHYIQF